MKFIFDSDPIEPNPNPKDREPTWAFLTAGGIATARKGDRDVAPERRAGQCNEPHCTSHVRSRQQGTTMRPLDGGVLSLRRARTPARGRGVEPLFFSLDHRGRLLLRLVLKGALRDEREGEGVNELGFRVSRGWMGFCFPVARARSSNLDGRR